MMHKGCGGEAVEMTTSAGYAWRNEDGVEELHPKLVCARCGVEVLGDVNLDLKQDDATSTRRITLVVELPSDATYETSLLDCLLMFDGLLDGAGMLHALDRGIKSLYEDVDVPRYTIKVAEDQIID